MKLIRSERVCDPHVFPWSKFIDCFSDRRKLLDFWNPHALRFIIIRESLDGHGWFLR